MESVKSEATLASDRVPSPVATFRELIAVATITVTALCLHLRGIAGPFFADDYLFLEQARGKSLTAVLSSPDPLGNFFRPVSRQAYFWFVGHAGHESPMVFHVVGLALFVVSVLTLYLVVRQLLDRESALFALAFVAVHYAADVPIAWASGSQDLLAVLFATLAVYLHSSRHRALACVALVLGLLSKEVVAGAAVIAIAVDRAPTESWRAPVRRALGLLSVTAGWSIWWLSSLGSRPAAGNSLSIHWGNLGASVAHLVQTAIGLEFRLGGGALGHWTVFALVPTAIVAAAFVWSSSRSRQPNPAPALESAVPQRAKATRAGIIWVAVAVLPLIPVMNIWSAYFYLWALFGVAVVGAAATARLRPALRAGALASLTFLSANARQLDEFALSGGPWAMQSHVNQHYIERSSAMITSYLRQLRTARPQFPSHSTIYFADVPPSLGWQAADGPLVRWAYRDSTLRSYFLTQFDGSHATRGPLFFFAFVGDSLLDKSDDPMMLPSFAFSMLLEEKSRQALEALDLALEHAPRDRDLYYWRAFARLAIGDSLHACEDLRTSGITPSRELRHDAGELVSRTGSDSSARLVVLTQLRREAGLNPWVHARLAALLLATGQTEHGTIEAYAYRVLAPNEPDAWRKWASAQLAAQQYAAALASLERYEALLRPGDAADPEASLAIQSLRRVVRGDLAEQGLRAH